MGLFSYLVVTIVKKFRVQTCLFFMVISYFQRKPGNSICFYLKMQFWIGICWHGCVEGGESGANQRGQFVAHMERSSLPSPRR